MAQFNPKEVIFCGHRRHYYMYNEELYTATFPIEWAENHLPGTGPKECSNCACYGSWNGVFIGYCANCADYEYNGECGRGFIDCGKENNAEEVQHFSSAFDTYLKNVNMDEIGDKDFVDSARMMMIEEVNEFVDSLEDESDEEDEEEAEEVGWCVDRYGYEYGSSYDGGYDSF